MVLTPRAQQRPVAQQAWGMAPLGPLGISPSTCNNARPHRQAAYNTQWMKQRSIIDLCQEGLLLRNSSSAGRAQASKTCFLNCCTRGPWDYYICRDAGCMRNVHTEAQEAGQSA